MKGGARCSFLFRFALQKAGKKAILQSLGNFSFLVAETLSMVAAGALPSLFRFS